MAGRRARLLRSLGLVPPPAVQTLGPLVGWPGAGLARLILALPQRDDAWVEAWIERAGAAPLRARAEPAHGLYRVYVFDFAGLAPGERVRYGFDVPEGPLDLEGLGGEDLTFRVPGELSEEDSFLLLSCHDPFATERGSAEEGWAMWPRLLAAIERDPGIRLLLLGGDQVYCDEVEAELLSSLEDEIDEVTADRVRRRFLEQYQRYWGDLSYRRVLARLPSVAMWDDHDITDGWGGRPESLDRDGAFLPAWRRYLDLAREAFAALQAARNPEPLPGVPAGSFTTAVDLGSSRLWLLDLRSERNAALGRVWGREHEAAFFRSLEAAPAACRSALVLTPVVAFRANLEEDRRLSALTRKLFAIAQWLENHRGLRTALGPLRWLTGALLVLAVLLDTWVDPWPLLPFLGLAVLLGVLSGPEAFLRIPELPNLTDDIEDALSSPPNRATLGRLLEGLFAWKAARGGEAALLSGDIHLCGMSEIVREQGGVVARLPQLVSSPISHAPMPKVAAGFTTTTSEMVLLDADDLRVWARNLFYLSRRNFAQVFPGRLGSAGAPFALHLEEHRLPLELPGRF